MKNVTVFCGSAEGRLPVYREAAETVGKELAKHGLGLVYGGGDLGLMGAVSRAAFEAGGKVLGIIPEAMTKIEGIGMLGETIYVKDMHTRKGLMNKNCDAFVGLPGGFGTFEEILEMATWHQLAIHAKPIIVLNINGFYEPLRTLLEHSIKEGFIREGFKDIIVFVDRPEDVVKALFDYDKVVDQYAIPWANPSEAG
ncbi:rossmann fold nucleotide-binding protein [Chytridium lagenaria]|nr:rossmann fold nucleotide-binding protein [Chytridium lagenaria]